MITKNYILVYGSVNNFTPIFISSNKLSLDNWINWVDLMYEPEYIVAKETILSYENIIEDKEYVNGMLKALYE